MAESQEERRARLKNSGWIGVDLDGTLAEYHGWVDGASIGKPIPLMVVRVKAWLTDGHDVRIFTARACNATVTEIQEIERWCADHIGQILVITHQKDHSMIELWDDRAVQVIANTGRRADGKPEFAKPGSSQP